MSKTTNMEKENEKGIRMRIQCPNSECRYGWNYRGSLRIYATCPSCRRHVKIAENKVKMPLQSATVGASATVRPEVAKTTSMTTGGTQL